MSAHYIGSFSKPEAYAEYALALFCTLFLLYFVLKVPIAVYRLLNHLKVREYLDLCNKVLSNKRLSEQARAIFLIDKAMALLLLGEFGQAEEISESIRSYIEKQTNENIKIIFYLNLFWLYCESDKLKEAKDIYEAKRELFAGAPTALKEIAGHALARYELFFGNVVKAKKMFLEYLPKEKRLNRLQTQYSIGLADLKLGNELAAKAGLEKIYKGSDGLYIHEKIKKIIDAN